MILPSHLIDLGFENLPSIIKLNNIAFVSTNEEILYNKDWSEWREVLEYLSLVLYAKEELEMIDELEIKGGENILKVRYHSVSLILMAQSTLDRATHLLCNFYNINIYKAKRLFTNDDFTNELSLHLLEFENLINKHKEYLTELSSYRNEWAHRVSGGFVMYSDNNPEKSNAKMKYLTSIDPSLDYTQITSEEYVNRVGKLNEMHGYWLIGIPEFVDKFALRTSEFVIDLLSLMLENET